MDMKFDIFDVFSSSRYFGGSIVEYFFGGPLDIVICPIPQFMKVINMFL